MSASIFKITRTRLLKCSTSLRASSRLYSAQVAHSSPLTDTEPPPTSSSTTLDTNASISATSEQPYKPTRTARAKPRKLQSLAQLQTPRKSILEPTGVDIYLSKLQAAGLEPTLADLERCRPRRHVSHTSSQYPEEYRRLLDTLCRSFSKDQLRMFLEMYGADTIWSRPRRRKAEYAEAIMEKQWDWPCLKEIERAKRDKTEVVAKSFSVNAHQLFLLLGRDGSDLLQMSLDFNVHVSLSADPLALNIEGFRGSLKKVEQHISSVKKGIVDEIYQLPISTPLPSHLIQRISRLAGAYLENLGQKGKVRIYAKDARGLRNAHRLASRASYKINSSTQPTLLSYLPPANSLLPVSMFPHSYALFPFLSPRTLPWIMNIAGAFRLRKVGEWLGNAQGEDIERTGGLAGGRSSICASDMTRIDLNQTMLHGTPPSEPGCTRTVKASLGHILFTTMGSNQRASLVPPLKGYHQFSKIMKWLEGNDSRPSFVPSLPSSLVNTSPLQQKIFHRLSYQALPSTISTPSTTELDGSLVHSVSPLVKTLSYEVELPRPDLTEDSRESELTGDWDTEVEQPSLLFVPHISLGYQRCIDLMMPDRTMDMQLSIVDSSTLSEDQAPQELTQYTTNMKEYLLGTDSNSTQPEPPLSVIFNGDTYILGSSDSVRQSADDENFDTDGSTSSVRVVTESVLDLESSQKATLCEVVCFDPSSEQNWAAFLSKCDKLTTTSRRPSLSHVEETPL